MPIKFGERLNPTWDALRARTLTGGEIAEAAINISAGGGLTNQIIVWHADTSPIALFDPNEAGLRAALAVCAWRDTLVIPSVDIQVTANVTLVSGMALAGLGENSILTFSGFSGTAITMATWAIIYNLGVRQFSNGTTALGIDGRFNSAVIAPCFVEVSGGSVSNIGVQYGAA